MRAAALAPLAAACIAAAHLAGCASESTLVREDPGFTAASLQKGGLAVLGVVQVDEVPQARPPLIDALERVLTGARRDIPLVTSDRAGAALPDSAKRLFLLGYQLRGDPDAVWLARAAEAARPLARYGVIARVTELRIRYGTRDIPPSDATGSRETAVRVTGRDVRVETTVYDLATRAVVYQAKFLGSTDAAPSTRPASADTLNPDSLPPQRTQPERPGEFRPGRGGFPTPGPSDSPRDLGYPDAPPIARAAEEAFLMFARALPGSPARPSPR
ncbi:MAG: hypothetical protein ACM3PF_09065 [Bacteroidota bacterium]